uniref:RRM domain-containing protein n=1 Tax=Zea mays TaxID=4577 RepID=A0A804MA49_MAIZE
MMQQPPPQQPQPGMAPPPPPQAAGGQPPQWGGIPPPMAQQYGAPPPQQPPAMWGQPPPQAHYGQAPTPQQYYAAPPVPVQAPAAPAAADEVRTLWIGDLQYWMDENYVFGCFSNTGEVQNVKLIRDKNSGQLQGYGFVEFTSRAAAERVLQTYNGQMMPNVDLTFRLNWASAGEKRDDTPEYTIFVGDLAADVTDYLLQETFRVHYPSVKGAKVVTDKLTMRTKGYGFVKFGDPTEQARAMTEMNGMPCSSRPMRIGPAASRKNTGGVVQERVPNSQGAQSENDPNNTTIFVGGLDPNVTEDTLKQVFSPYGEVVHVKIPVGKRCGFVQFVTRMFDFHGVEACRTSRLRNPINGVRLLVLVATMGAMDKVMRLMAVGMHNPRILTCMVMALMAVIPITNSNQLHSSNSNNSDACLLG